MKTKAILAVLLMCILCVTMVSGLNVTQEEIGQQWVVHQALGDYEVEITDKNSQRSTICFWEKGVTDIKDVKYDEQTCTEYESVCSVYKDVCIRENKQGKCTKYEQQCVEETQVCVEESKEKKRYIYDLQGNVITKLNPKKEGDKVGFCRNVADEVAIKLNPTVIYQNQSKMVIDDVEFTAELTISKFNGEEYVIAPDEVWIYESGNDKYKFGWNDTVATNDTNYQITINSTKSMTYDDETNILVYASQRTYLGQGTYEVLYTQSDLSDICAPSNNCSYTLNNTEDFSIFTLTTTGIYDETLFNGSGGIWMDPTIEYSISEGGVGMQNVTFDGPAFHLSVSNSSLVAYYQFDESNAKDLTDNNNDGNVTGATKISDGKYGSAYEFDGVDDYINLDTHVSSFENICEGTILLWFKSNTSSGQDALVNIGEYGTDDRFELLLDESNNLQMYVREASAHVTFSDTDDPVVINDTWVHAAYVSNTSGHFFYINGELVPSTASIGSDTDQAFFCDVNNLGTMTIGSREAYNHVIIDNYEGTIDEVMIFNESLTSEEIENIYNQTKQLFYPTGKFVPETQAITPESNATSIMTVLQGATLDDTSFSSRLYYIEDLDDYTEYDDARIYLHWDGNSSQYGKEDWGIDASSGHAEAYNSTGRFAQSAIFNASNNEWYRTDITITDEVEALTVSTYFKVNSYVGNMGIVTNRGFTGINGLALVSSTQLRAYAEQDGVTCDIEYVNNRWHHGAMTYNASTGLIKVYIDGTHCGTENVSNGNITFSDEWYFGTDSYDINARSFDGEIDETFIFYDELSDDEILNLFRFSNPTPFIEYNTSAEYESTDALLYYRFDGDNTNYGTAGWTLSTTGSPTYESVRALWNESVYFDGSSSYFSTNTYTASMSGFTMSMWVHPETLSPYDGFLTSRAGSYALFYMGNAPTYYPTINIGGGDYVECQETLKVDEWAHLVARYNSSTGNMSVFKDGVLCGQSIETAKTVTIADVWRIGVDDFDTATRDFDGYIDELYLFDYVISDEKAVELYNQPPSRANTRSVGLAWNESTSGLQNCTTYASNAVSCYHEIPLNTVEGISPEIFFNSNENASYTPYIIAVNATSMPLPPTVYSVTLSESSGDLTVVANISDLYGLKVSNVTSYYKDGVLNVSRTQDNLIAFYPLDHDTWDYSINNNNGVVQGTNSGTVTGATHNLYDGKYGGAYSLDGSGDYITTGGTPINGQDSVTYAAWIYADTIDDYQAVMISRDTNNDGLAFHTGDVPRIYVSSSGGNTYCINSTVIPTGEWVHMAGTWTSGETPKLYINGVLSGCDSDGGAVTGTISASNAFKIGRDDTSAARDFDGYIDEVRVWSEVLTEEEIQAEMNSNRPLVFDGLKMSYSFDLDASDFSNIQTGKIDRGMDFDGSNDYVNIGNPSELQFTSPFTLSAWIDTTKSSANGIIMKHTLGGESYAMDVSSSKLRFYTFDSSDTIKIVVSDDDVDTGEWVHVVGQWNGTHNIVFVNGVQQSGATAVTTLDNEGADVYIGSKSDGSYNFDGVIDDVQIYDVALTPTQVQQLYAASVNGGDELSSTYTSEGNWTAKVQACNAFSCSNAFESNTIEIGGEAPPSICPHSWAGEGTQASPCLIDGTGTINVSNAYYEYTTNVTTYTSSGIDILASNVVIDGAGYTIDDSNFDFSNHGIDCTNQNNITITNITIGSFTGYEIFTSGCDDVTLDYVDIPVGGLFFDDGDTITYSNSDILHAEFTVSDLVNSRFVNLSIDASPIPVTGITIWDANNMTFENLYIEASTQDSISDTSSASNINTILFDNEFGTIDYTKSDIDFAEDMLWETDITITNNSIYIADSYGTFNGTDYNITIKDVATYTDPVVLRNAAYCFTDCVLQTAINATDVTFTTNTTGNYSIGEKPVTVNITSRSLFDENATIYNNTTNVTGRAYDDMYFNYTNVTDSLGQTINVSTLIVNASGSVVLNESVIVSDGANITTSAFQATDYSLHNYTITVQAQYSADYVISGQLQMINEVPEITAISTVVGLTEGACDDGDTCKYNIYMTEDACEMDSTIERINVRNADSLLVFQDLSWVLLSDTYDNQCVFRTDGISLDSGVYSVDVLFTDSQNQSDTFSRSVSVGGATSGGGGGGKGGGGGATYQQEGVKFGIDPIDPAFVLSPGESKTYRIEFTNMGDAVPIFLTENSVTNEHIDIVFENGKPYFDFVLEKDTVKEIKYTLIVADDAPEGITAETIDIDTSVETVNYIITVNVRANVVDSLLELLEEDVFTFDDTICANPFDQDNCNERKFNIKIKHIVSAVTILLFIILSMIIIGVVRRRKKKKD